MSTTMDPEFLITNALRAMQATSRINLQGIDIKGMAKKASSTLQRAQGP